MAYLLDADVFIRAKRDHYRFTFCPGFWGWLLKANGSDKVFGIDKVKAELESGTDELARWAAARSSLFFLIPDSTVTAAAARVSTWVNEQRYEPQAIVEFFQSADYWLVAHALAKGWKVVTHEVSAPGSRKKVKLPDVCDGVWVSCSNPFQMLDDERAHFVLGPKP